MTLEIWTPIFVFWIISFFYIGSNLVIALNVGGGGGGARIGWNFFYEICQIKNQVSDVCL